MSVEDPVPESGVRQVVYRVDRHRKKEMLKHLLGNNEWPQVLVFIRTKYGAARLAKQLDSEECRAVVVHSGMGKATRAKVLETFTSGEARVLVTTDIVTKSLDELKVANVLNYDIPPTLNDFNQRLACSADDGEALFLVCVDEDERLGELQQQLGRELPAEIIEGFEPDPSIKPQEAEEKKQPEKKARNNRKPQKKTQDRNNDNASRGNRRSQGRNRRDEPNGNVAQNSRRQYDEHGDVNGNTLNSDNANRSAIDLACDGNVRRKKRGTGNVNGNVAKKPVKAREGNLRSNNGGRKRRGGRQGDASGNV